MQKEMTIIVLCSFVFFSLGAIVGLGSIALASPEAEPAVNQVSGGIAPELHSPSDWIKQRQIHVYSNRIVLDIPNAAWSNFADTNSMDPVLDFGANGIEIKPESPDDINMGDIVAYEQGDTVIIHRVIEKAIDEQGVYFITKGDNNRNSDSEKIRFNQIKGVLVAVIY